MPVPMTRTRNTMGNIYAGIAHEVSPYTGRGLPGTTAAKEPTGGVPALAAPGPPTGTWSPRCGPIAQPWSTTEPRQGLRRCADRLPDHRIRFIGGPSGAHRPRRDGSGSSRETPIYRRKGSERPCLCQFGISKPRIRVRGATRGAAGAREECLSVIVMRKYGPNLAGAVKNAVGRPSPRLARRLCAPAGSPGEAAGMCAPAGPLRAAARAGVPSCLADYSV